MKQMLGLSNLNINLMSLWRSVQHLSKRIEIKRQKDIINEYEAAATDVPAHNSGKRGSELKIIFRRTDLGKLHFCGISIGKYTSKTERSMRTLNSRINAGRWSQDGAFNVCKIRLLYYYNRLN